MVESYLQLSRVLHHLSFHYCSIIFRNRSIIGAEEDGSTVAIVLVLSPNIALDYKVGTLRSPSYSQAWNFLLPHLGTSSTMAGRPSTSFYCKCITRSDVRVLTVDPTQANNSKQDGCRSIAKEKAPTNPHRRVKTLLTETSRLRRAAQ